MVSVSQLSFDRRSSEARDTSGEVAWPEVGIRVAVGVFSAPKLDASISSARVSPRES